MTMSAQHRLKTMSKEKLFELVAFVILFVSSVKLRSCQQDKVITLQSLGLAIVDCLRIKVSRMSVRTWFTFFVGFILARSVLCYRG